jgi:nitrous oxide reductase accessory protein NosL
MNVRTSVLLVALAATTGLAACATPQEPELARGRQMPMGDMAQMCDMHQKMMAGKSPEEQQAMMESHMKAMHGSVDPQMVARHRQMMDQNCPGPGQGNK